jgi:hypothetical protein
MTQHEKLLFNIFRSPSDVNCFQKQNKRKMLCFIFFSVQNTEFTNQTEVSRHVTHKTNYFQHDRIFLFR